MEILIAIPLAIVILWKVLGNCVNEEYREWINENNC